MPHSLSDGHDRPEINRAIVNTSVPAGGLTEDIAAMAADEDQRIVGFSGGKNSNSGFLELSFSSTAEIGGGSGNHEDTQTAWVLAGNGGSIAFGDYDEESNYVEWDEDEELHIHGVNNTGSGIQMRVVVYYLEERDC